MAKLVTDWVKVAESGKTIDGRVIEASWLRDAAELYSKDKYTAVITLEHYSPEWAGNYGTVEALKTEEAGDIVSLYAKLCPSDELRYINKQGQKLFTSIKLHPDFQSSGRAYVLQIGVTDTPASVGTQQLEFRKGTDEHISIPVELTEFSLGDENRLFEKFKALFSAQHQKDSEDEEEPMKPEELKAAIAEAFAEGFAALPTALQAMGKETQEEEAPAETVAKEEFTAQQERADKAEAELAEKLKEFNALEEKVKALEQTDVLGGQDDQQEDNPGF